jgi:sulfite reductase alpha subunit-like flavoprotein
MAEYNHDRLTETGLLIVATSTTGNGVPPENATALHSFLSEGKVNLNGRRFAVLSLGDSFRTHFAQCGKDFDRMLEDLGGKRIINRIDTDGVVEAPLKEFINDLLKYFEREPELYPTFIRAEAPQPVLSAPSKKSDNATNGSAKSKDKQKKGILSRIKRRVVNKIRGLI